ncbi:AEC family transporter [Roseovarius faecimaris]|uniref:AEC family transporter n=1 Tax=Roseovarius faecimaris TaxID=2494550 RepID=A0A6I6IP34_9RHOB|nr:AEC family transporter [Roseovarius faecimaris]QGX98900.1 AEC family transporter [Roseovarius faecimaris]
MQALLDVILPVFSVIGFGYLAVRVGWFSTGGVDGLMKFTQNFAIPCLLFLSIARLDLAQVFEWELLLSFYTGSSAGFFLGLFGARLLFHRAWDEAVAIGFCCLFSNSVLLGLALTERAYGADALEANFAIIAVHSPFCYGLGITVMEIVRAQGQPGGRVPGKVLRAMFSNALVIGIGLGFIVNLTGLVLPAVLMDGLDLMARAALPAAIFGMGGVLAQYRPEGDLRVVFYICLVALVVHPAITRSLAWVFDLSTPATRSAVITAAMAPGVNSYIFANMYGVARRVAATSVLVATVLSIGTAWVWLGVLP